MIQISSYWTILQCHFFTHTIVQDFLPTRLFASPLLLLFSRVHNDSTPYFVRPSVGLSVCWSVTLLLFFIIFFSFSHFKSFKSIPIHSKSFFIIMLVPHATYGVGLVCLLPADDVGDMNRPGFGAPFYHHSLSWANERNNRDIRPRPKNNNNDYLNVAFNNPYNCINNNNNNNNNNNFVAKVWTPEDPRRKGGDGDLGEKWCSGMFLLTTKNMFIPVERVYNVNPYSWSSTVSQRSEQSEWVSEPVIGASEPVDEASKWAKWMK